MRLLTSAILLHVCASHTTLLRVCKVYIKGGKSLASKTTSCPSYSKAVAR